MIEYLWVGVYTGTALFAAAAAFTLVRPMETSRRQHADGTGAGLLDRPGTGAAAGPFEQRMDDAAFLREALARGRAEVALCAAAARYGRSPAIRRLACRLVQSHWATNAEIDRLALVHGIHARRYRIATPRGAASLDDEEFLRRELDAQELTIALFERQARCGRGREVREFAARMLPALREGRQLLEYLQRGMEAAAGRGARFGVHA
jgi:predicted outer membrane protein